MENQVQQIVSLSNLPDEKIHAYNPREYGFIGLIFGLIPVFIMSLSNARVFQNGDVIWRRMKIYLWIYVIGFFALIIVIMWLTYSLYNNYPSGVCSSSANYVAVSSSTFYDVPRVICPNVLPPMLSDSFINIVSYSKYVFFGFNFIMLISIYMFAKAVELPVYLQLKESGRLVGRRFFVPVLIGLILPFCIYFLLNSALGFFGELVQGS